MEEEEGEEAGKQPRKRCNNMGFGGDTLKKKTNQRKPLTPSKHNKQQTQPTKKANTPTPSMLQMFRFAYN